jgi:hypothetical protein
MSLINSILGQKVILLLVGGILLIFLVAVGLNFAVAVRAAAKRRARRRAAEEARAAAAKKARARAKAAQVAAREAKRRGLPDPALAESTLAAELGDAAQLVITEAAQAVVGEALTPPSVTMAGPTANAAAAPQIMPTMQAQALGAPLAEQPKKDENKDDKEKNEIQSMLADVFEDEESDERMELLLSDTEAIPADDLLAQMNRIAQQLNSKNTPLKDDTGPDNRKASRAS